MLSWPGYFWAGGTFRPPTLATHPPFEPLYYQHYLLKMDAREVAIQNAIQDLNSGVFTSQRKAAKAYGVPRSSLQSRLAGRQTHAIAHQHQQRLTPDQEQFLVEWIIDEDSRAQPPTHTCVREMATWLLRMNGDNNPLGVEWISQFLSRQPRVASIVGRSIENPRA